MKNLKVFKGFQVDMAVIFTDLSPAQIRTLRVNGIIRPKKTSIGYIYDFSDIITLRLIRILRELGVKLNNIKDAYLYVKKLDPERNLNHYKLYVEANERRILAFTDDETLVKTDGYGQGQTVVPGIIEKYEVGVALERTRKSITALNQAASQAMSAKPKLLSLGDIQKKYGVAK